MSHVAQQQQGAPYGDDIRVMGVYFNDAMRACARLCQPDGNGAARPRMLPSRACVCAQRHSYQPFEELFNGQLAS